MPLLKKFGVTWSIEVRLIFFENPKYGASATEMLTYSKALDKFIIHYLIESTSVISDGHMAATKVR